MENKIESSKLLGFKFLESGQMRVLVLAQYFPLNMMRQFRLPIGFLGVWMLRFTLLGII